MKKQTMKKRKMKSLTLQERILLCEIDEIDWDYNVKAIKTHDIRTTIQGEQDKTRREDIHPEDTGIRQG